MKIDVDVVTGFLGAGKTTFINSLICESKVSGENILVVQFEEGQNKINITNNIKSIYIKEVSLLRSLLKKEIYKNKINRVIIEYNGTEKIDLLLEIFTEKEVKCLASISTVYFVVDGKTINEYINNISDFLIPFIMKCNMAVVNNTEESNRESLSLAIKKIKSLNPKAFVLQVPNKYTINEKLREANVLEKGILKRIKIKLINLNLNKKGSK